MNYICLSFGTLAAFFNCSKRLKLKCGIGGQSLFDMTIWLYLFREHYESNTKVSDMIFPTLEILANAMVLMDLIIGSTHLTVEPPFL